MNKFGRKSWQIALICFTLGLISCKQEVKEQAEAKYAVMKISANAEKEVMTSYSAAIEGKQDIEIYPRFRVILNDYAYLKEKRYVKDKSCL